MMDGMGGVLVCLVLVVLVTAFSFSAKAGTGVFSRGTSSVGVEDRARHFVSDERDGNEMTSERALRLIEAWAKTKGRSWALQTLTERPNGDFDVNVGAAGFRFIKETQTLLVSGYVASGQVDLVIPIAGERMWNRLVSIGALQPTTLGGGELELYTGVADPRSEKPAVYLTKQYSIMPESPDKFVIEVQWLVRSATYWRDERWDEVFSARTPEQLRKEALEAEAWAQGNLPRELKETSGKRSLSILNWF